MSTTCAQLLSFVRPLFTGTMELELNAICKFSIKAIIKALFDVSGPPLLKMLRSVMDTPVELSLGFPMTVLINMPEGADDEIEADEIDGDTCKGLTVSCCVGASNVICNLTNPNGPFNRPMKQWSITSFCTFFDQSKDPSKWPVQKAHSNGPFKWPIQMVVK
jgi:hypothetical protein